MPQSPLIFRTLFDARSSTYTYLLADAGEAVLVDPVLEHARRDEAVLRELGLRLAWTLETHVHADHVSAGAMLRRRLGSKVALSERAGAQGADRSLQSGDQIAFGARHLRVLATPGHTDGCVSFVLDDASRVFTGDCLLIRGCGRTDFQQGDAATLFASVREQLFALPGTCLVHPAHDYHGLVVSSIDEERQHNPRLGDAIAREDFITTMSHLGLAHPKQMAQAVPANLRCGELDGVAMPGGEPDWAQLSLGLTGVWEITPNALAEVLRQVLIVDVRSRVEFDGPLGHLAGSTLAPLPELPDACAAIDRQRPVVVVCRSGARSARAAALLKQAGFDRVANLGGGLLRWRGEGGEVVGGDPA